VSNFLFNAILSQCFVSNNEPRVMRANLLFSFALPLPVPSAMFAPKLPLDFMICLPTVS